MLMGYSISEPLTDQRTVILMVIVLATLTVAQIVGYFLGRQPETTWNPAVVRAFNLRLRAYWMMSAILATAFLVGTGATVFLFFCVSFWALREFITLTPTRMGDHRALFWVFFIFAPFQYFLVFNLPRDLARATPDRWYDLFVVTVPVFGFLFIATRIALAGDSKRFLERAAKTQAALLICVYALSYAPALLCLDLRDLEKNPTHADPAGLLFFFVVMVQLGDLLQYAWGHFIGKHVIAPEIHASRTWEGVFGGVLSTSLLGIVFSWVTPFREVEAAIMSLVIAIMGFAGTMTLSAIKRDRGVKDYGTLVRGHAGVLDRIDSMCFAAPVFFHLTRLLYT
jgi:phosphatidate cytidylyltransferase